MAHDVFISYSSQDKLTADAVCAVLEARGIRCWIAPRDIPFGADWTETIVNSLESCRIMVLIFSQHANESKQIKREVNLAVDSGVTVIPLRVEDIMPSKSLKFSITINHWLDAFPPPLENHLDVLARSIRGHLAASAIIEEPPREEQPKAAVPLGSTAPLSPPVSATPPSSAPEAIPLQSPPLAAIPPPSFSPPPVPSVPAVPTTSSFQPPSVLPSAAVPQTPSSAVSPPPSSQLPPAPPRRNIFLLIAMGYVWMMVFAMVGIFLFMLVGINLSSPIVLISTALSAWLTWKGKLPGTRKRPVI
jgi:hypothetical protein